MTDQPRIAAIVLAAGFSNRFGSADKLAAKLGADSVLAKTLAAYNTPCLARKIAIVQPDSPHAEICRRAGFDVAINDDAAGGMGGSIACAIKALDNATHALIGLGDMPMILPSSIEHICRAIDPAYSIIIPGHNGRRGHPRLFSAVHFSSLAQLTGDSGARHLIAACPHVLDIAVNDAGLVTDIDTPNALAALQ